MSTSRDKPWSSRPHRRAAACRASVSLSTRSRRRVRAVPEMSPSDRRAAASDTAIRTGTMGWSYEDWRGVFYTADLPASRMLEQYARVFPTVELDTTFY